MRTQRLTQILDYIDAQQMCTYEDICDAFQISLSTARRDINALAKEQAVHKVYGGVTSASATSALLDSSLNQSLVSSGLSEDVSEKLDDIGRKAASFVEAGDVIFVGSGATAFHMLPYLKEIPNVTIISNNLLFAYPNQQTDKDIILVGGTIDYYAQSTVGVQTTDFLRTLNINKAFLSCNGLSINKGFTNSSGPEVIVKNCVFENSESIYMMVDDSKFDRLSLYSFASLDDIDYLITNKKPGVEFVDAMAAHNVTLIY